MRLAVSRGCCGREVMVWDAAATEIARAAEERGDERPREETGDAESRRSAVRSSPVGSIVPAGAGVRSVAETGEGRGDGAASACGGDAGNRARAVASAGRPTEPSWLGRVRGRDRASAVPDPTNSTGPVIEKIGKSIKNSDSRTKNY